MIGLVKKCWHDPVWSKVIAGAILALAAVCLSYLLDWWPIIGAKFAAIIDAALATTAVPNWLLLVLIIPLLFVLAVIALVFLRGRKRSQPSITWLQYTTDIFFNIRWRWRYDEKQKIVDLFSFCSSCDFQIYPKSKYDILGHPTEIYFRCDSCGLDFGNYREDPAQFENRIFRHIQQKIRNDSWSKPA